MCFTFAVFSKTEMPSRRHLLWTSNQVYYLFCWDLPRTERSNIRTYKNFSWPQDQQCECDGWDPFYYYLETFRPVWLLGGPTVFAYKLHMYWLFLSHVFAVFTFIWPSIHEYNAVLGYEGGSLGTILYFPMTIRKCSILKRFNTKSTHCPNSDKRLTYWQDKNSLLIRLWLSYKAVNWPFCIHIRTTIS